MTRSRREVLIALGTGVLAGVSSGLLGVGGGIIIVPLLVAFASLNQHEAHATSLAALVPIALVGAARFGVDGSIDLAVAGWLALGALAGAPLGARLMARTSERTLQILFGVLILAVAFQMLLA